MKNIDKKLKENLEKLAREAFGEAFESIKIEVSEDHYGDPQISVECTLNFGEEFPLSEERMTNLARTNIDLKMKFLNSFQKCDEERPLFSGLNFAQDQEAA